MDRLGYQLQELEDSRATELAALSSQVWKFHVKAKQVLSDP